MQNMVAKDVNKSKFLWSCEHAKCETYAEKRTQTKLYQRVSVKPSPNRSQEFICESGVNNRESDTRTGSHNKIWLTLFVYPNKAVRRTFMHLPLV